MSIIYLDHAATTPPLEVAASVAALHVTETWGNPSSIYKIGREAFGVVQAARERVANLINATPEQIIFTSSGSEANALAVIGSRKYIEGRGQAVVLISSCEHKSLVATGSLLAATGSNATYRVVKMPVRSDGTVSVKELNTYLTNSNVGMVSIMHVNNELGSVNPIEEIADLCKEKGVLFHTDCVQSAGFFNLDVERIGCDMMSLSAHKMGGLRGAGALYVRDKSKLTPYVGGGKQEFGLRGGTENTASIAAFALACEHAKKNLAEIRSAISCNRQTFYNMLIEALSEFGLENRVGVNGASVIKPSRILSLTIDGVDGETLVLMLSSLGVYISTGSACTSGELERSHVLRAIGLSNSEIDNTVRISFSESDRREDLQRAAASMAELVARLVGTLK